MNGLMDRFLNQERESFDKMNSQTSPASINMPLMSLSLSKTEMTDLGFKNMLGQFSKMHQRSVQTNREFEGNMELDISANNLTDESVRAFADLITKFEGFRAVNMGSLRSNKGRKGAKDLGFAELASALMENQSIERLDLRDNEISEASVMKIFEALEHNFVLTDLKLDVKQRHIPSGFSCYALQSMYEFMLTTEDISLI